MYQGTIPTSYTLECDIVSFTNGDYNASAEVIASHTSLYNRVASGTTKTTLAKHNSNYSNVDDYTDYTVHNAPFHLKVVVNGGNATYYIDNTQIGSKTSGNNDIGIKSYRNRGIVIKNLKIKAL